MIHLEKITKDNWHECIKLPTGEDHAHNVAPNVYSIAEAQFYPATVKSCAVYDAEQVVGYTMYGPEEDDATQFWIDRLMIAEGQRGKGYGRQVLRLIKEEAKSLGFDKVYLSTHPDNAKAIGLYASEGFKATGEISDGEEIFICQLGQAA